MPYYLIGKTYSQDEIDKSSSSAYESELQLANEIGKYKGYHELMFTKASEFLKPVTESTSIRMKQETDEQIRKDIQNDPTLTTTDKLRLLGGIDKIKIEKHTTEDDRRTIKPEETRRKEIVDAFRVQDDYIFGLVDIPGAPNEYMFGVINLLDNLKMMRFNSEPMNHHRIKFNVDTNKVEVAARLYTENPVQLSWPYSKDLLWLLTQNTLEGSVDAKANYMSIVDACLREDLEGLRYEIHSPQERLRYYEQFLHRVEDNIKFEKWLSLKYKIPIKLQPKRAETSGRTRYTDTSIYKHREEEEEGSGMLPIYLSPHADDRIKRAFVLLGNRKSSKEDNSDSLAEFTSILDSLLSEGSLSIRKYKLLMKKWSA